MSGTDMREFYKNLPKKRMASGVLFLNNKNEILILKPTYRDGWNIPGGIIELNESPLTTAKREVLKEIGLKISDLKLLCVEYAPEKNIKTESLLFVFYGGTVSEEQIELFTLPPEEISEFRFVADHDVCKLLPEYLSMRVRLGLQALQNNTVYYTESI